MGILFVPFSDLQEGEIQPASNISGALKQDCFFGGVPVCLAAWGLWVSSEQAVCVSFGSEKAGLFPGNSLDFERFASWLQAGRKPCRQRCPYHHSNGHGISPQKLQFKSLLVGSNKFITLGGPETGHERALSQSPIESSFRDT